MPPISSTEIVVVYLWLRRYVRLEKADKELPRKNSDGIEVRYAKVCMNCKADCSASETFPLVAANQLNTT